MIAAKAARIIPILFLALAACGSNPKPEPIVRTVTVYSPTPVSCVPKDYAAPPVSPVTRNALLAASDAAERYALLSRFWTAETPVLALQSGVIAACRGAGRISGLANSTAQPEQTAQTLAMTASAARA